MDERSLSHCLAQLFHQVYNKSDFSNVGGGGGTPYISPYGEAPSKRGSFFRLKVYKRVGIPQVKIYKRVGKYVS